MKSIIIKRTADWLEKMSVAAMAVGVFQGKVLGVLVGLGCYLASILLTYLGGRK